MKTIVEVETTDKGYINVYEDGTRSQEYIRGEDYPDEEGLQPVILADLIICLLYTSPSPRDS